MSSFDLHVLGTPPAFILSQDQTLILKFNRSSFCLAFRFTDVKFTLTISRCSYACVYKNF